MVNLTRNDGENVIYKAHLKEIKKEKKNKKRKKKKKKKKDKAHLKIPIPSLKSKRFCLEQEDLQVFFSIVPRNIGISYRQLYTKTVHQWGEQSGPGMHSSRVSPVWLWDSGFASGLLG